MAGIQPQTDHVAPLTAVRSLAERAANQRGTSLVGSDLRLFANPDVSTSGAAGERATEQAGVDDGIISPFALGRTYELLLSPADRQKTGAHLTPETVARQLVGLMASPSPSDRVLDPAVGGAAFLLAAADQLVAAGADPVDAAIQLHGFDIDPGAVAVAEAALALWEIDHGNPPRALRTIAVGDGLLVELPRVERVVGNPPFLNQLRSTSSHTAERRAALKQRWNDLVGAYTDDAWLFLAAGIDALVAGGSAAMVQPMSILAARHGDNVRRYIAESNTMTSLWVGRDRVFDAAVQVCGLVFTAEPNAATKLQRYVGAEFESCAPLPSQPDASAWGAAASVALDVPQVDLVSSRCGGSVGDLATATAGFRDQFYGFVPYVAEHDAPITLGELPASVSPLVTVGMIDVLELGWGVRSHRFAGTSYDRPCIDVAKLREEDPRLGEWVDARLQPKILMATQTRVVELWVDRVGSAIPATPVLSIEPRPDASDSDASASDALDSDASDSDSVEPLFLLAAALSSPAVSAHVVAQNFGTALSLNAMKLAARDVLAAPLPKHDEPWHEAARLVAGDSFDLRRFGQLMNKAYGLRDSNLIDWWLKRLPNHSSAS